jgi:hypothetical protein
MEHYHCKKRIDVCNDILHLCLKRNGLTFCIQLFLFLLLKKMSTYIRVFGQ